MNLELIYEISPKNVSFYIPFIPIVAGFIIAKVAFPWLLKKNLISGSSSPSFEKQFKRAQLFILFLGSVITLIWFGRTYYLFNMLSEGKARIVEGYVEEFSRYKNKKGHVTESITVNGHTFSYGKNWSISFSGSNKLSHRYTEGKWVKIYYVDRAIVKFEIQPSRNPRSLGN